MNLVGAYDDLDMTGLRPEWYENVPRWEQRPLEAFDGEELRIIWNPVQRYTVVVRSPNTVVPYHGGHLVGWAILTHWPFPLSGDAIAKRIGLMQRLAHYRDAEHMEAEIDRKIEAAKEREEKADDHLVDDFVDDQWPTTLDQEEALIREFERETEMERDAAHAAAEGREHRRGKLILPTGVGGSE